MSDERSQTTDFTDADIPVHRVVRTPYPEQLRAAHAELVRLREFVQWVADNCIDTVVAAEARRHGAE